VEGAWIGRQGREGRGGGNQEAGHGKGCVRDRAPSRRQAGDGCRVNMQGVCRVGVQGEQGSMTDVMCHGGPLYPVHPGLLHAPTQSPYGTLALYTASHPPQTHPTHHHHPRTPPHTPAHPALHQAPQLPRQPPPPLTPGDAGRRHGQGAVGEDQQRALPQPPAKGVADGRQDLGEAQMWGGEREEGRRGGEGMGRSGARSSASVASGRRREGAGGREQLCVHGRAGGRLEQRGGGSGW
jgi:hypothetical protein